MPGSQLKRLKASLREQGVIGPQKSKKQKKTNGKDEKAKNQKRLQKAAALEAIRENFNPFDLKHNVRGPKFDVTTNRPATGNAAKSINGRPSEAKALSEARRRETLLIEMQRRNKVGGILDRRFGEDDPNMTPEAKMLERFTREKLRSHKKGSMFDLEEDEESGVGLTHMGKSLTFDDDNLGAIDDFNEKDLEDGSEDDSGDDERPNLKRSRPFEFEDTDGQATEDQPERKKTKQEVMKEVIAKSKFYKYERQAAKDADEDLREELDQQLPDLHSLLFNRKADPKNGQITETGGDADQVAAERERLRQEYDVRVRQLALDRRAQPSERTKTEEEKAGEESARLKELEEKRVRRMRGEEESEDESANEDDKNDADVLNGPIQFIDNQDDDDFGLGKGIRTRPTATELGFDDEDDFLIEDELIASGSELETSDGEQSSNEDEEEDSADDDAEEAGGDEDDDEFTKGLLNDEEAKNPAFAAKLNNLAGDSATQDDPDGLPYTFACPQTHEELLEVTKGIVVDKLPTVVQRIRALYHPKLDSSNKSKLANFSKILVQHLAYLASSSSTASFSVLESLTRHLHSLAKTFPVEIANEFRSRIEEISESRPLSPNAGDLVIFTAIGTIFPTSDHFHQVVTPAMLSMSRYLGQKVPRDLDDLAKGAYLSILAVQYQQISKRYVPELMNFCLNALCSVAPVAATEKLGPFPIHAPPAEIRIRGAKSTTLRKLSYSDIAEDTSGRADSLSTAVGICGTIIQVLDAAADLWKDKSAFEETFSPVEKVLGHLTSKGCKSELPAALNDLIVKIRTKMGRMLKLAELERRPLELHHHRPLAIKMAIPRFEDSFDPSKHYDPDRERAELAKLKAEHKKERKGAMRELRKDANFMAREKLRVKKQKDEAYEKKYKRLVAEIQSEEGGHANAYEREKTARKRASKRA